MKAIFRISLLTVLLVSFVAVSAYSQTEADSTNIVAKHIYIIEKNDGSQFIGEIISQNAREVLIKTEKLGELYIPMHEISSIKEVTSVIKEGKRFLGEELFATRYFITTNGIPIKKGENYMIWNLYGPDFQFGIADNFGIGIMTSWMAMPIIANAKYSIQLGSKTNMAIGMLAGTGSWALPKFGLLLPFTAFTLGDHRHNINVSLGYGSIFYQRNEWNPNTSVTTNINEKEGRVLFSIAGMTKITSKISLVFDSFIVPRGPYKNYTEWTGDGGYYNEKEEWISTPATSYTNRKRSPNMAILLPGIRWQMDSNKAFQFGFTGLNFDGKFSPAPIPMVQWFRRL